MPTAIEAPAKQKARHSALVRVTHWLTFVSFMLLLVTGAEIVISHPRFYWGETGNVNMHPLFVLPIASSRDTVPTAYHYVIPDQNGWSRYLHFESAWLLVFTALVYGIASFLNGHFRRNLIPERRDWHWRAYWLPIARCFRRAPPNRADAGSYNRVDASSYNTVQRTTYLLVIFVLFPLIIWTGLALSPAFDSAVPAAVNLLGGRQSARTLHFFLTLALVVFLLVHVTMVALSGFRAHMRGIITGRAETAREGPLMKWDRP